MKIVYKNKRVSEIFFLAVVLFFCTRSSFPQSGPQQRAVTVTPVQAIHFGAFCVTGSSGGTITVGSDGSRTSTGDIALLTISPTATPAIFEIKSSGSRNVALTFNTTATLANGRNLLSLDIGSIDKTDNRSSFQTNGNRDHINQLRIGGTLTVPGTALPGNYSGSFNITFNQE